MYVLQGTVTHAVRFGVCTESSLSSDSAHITKVVAQAKNYREIQKYFVAILFSSGLLVTFQNYSTVSKYPGVVSLSDINCPTSRFGAAVMALQNNKLSYF